MGHQKCIRTYVAPFTCFGKSDKLLGPNCRSIYWSLLAYFLPPKESTLEIKDTSSVVLQCSRNDRFKSNILLPSFLNHFICDFLEILLVGSVHETRQRSERRQKHCVAVRAGAASAHSLFSRTMMPLGAFSRTLLVNIRTSPTCSLFSVDERRNTKLSKINPS